MIAKKFGFTRDFLKERNTGLYCRLKKTPCGCKDRASTCLLMDFPGSSQPLAVHTVALAYFAADAFYDIAHAVVVLQDP